MERRPLGRTGCELSIVGFGGIVVKDVTPAEAARSDRISRIRGKSRTRREWEFMRT